MAKEEKTKILVIEDNPDLQQLIRDNLVMLDYEPLSAKEGEEGLRMIAEEKPSLVLLDLGLPDTDGFELLEEIREESKIPVIVITVREEEENIVKGLKMGADDYVVKPFGIPQLMARIEAVLRRTKPWGNLSHIPTFSGGGLEVDFVARHVTVDDEEIHLTPTEFRLLQVLLESQDKVVEHWQLLSKVWGLEYRDDVAILRATVYRLRRKIGARFIKNESGVGYVFRLPPQG